MNTSIFALSTAVPPYAFNQEDIANQMIDVLKIDKEKADQLRHLYRHSAIQKRYSVVPDFLKCREEWHFWGKNYPENEPSMASRNALYKQEAPRLAREAAQKALHAWGGDPSTITHVISVSCTGVMAPGIEFDLMQALNLKQSVNRLGINFMGCFGAFKGLSVAQSFAKEHPTHRILLVCTELCSLHLQSTLTHDHILGNSLFSDGAAAAIVGLKPKTDETPLWEIHRCGSWGMENSRDKMTWEAGDTGFLMTLSPFVPVLLGRNIRPFMESLLVSDAFSEECDWAIHPGGKSIIQAIEKAIKLDRTQTQASWDILAEYGNMSSSTFLFVLERLVQQRTSRSWTIGLGFGPGLSFEGIVLRKPL